jgi:chromosome segregation ATPase
MASVSEKEDEVRNLHQKIKSHEEALVSATESSSATKEQITAQIEELRMEHDAMKESVAKTSAELEAKISENQQVSEALENAKSALALECEKLKKAEEDFQGELKTISEAREQENAETQAKISELEKVLQAKDSQIIQIEDSIKVKLISLNSINKFLRQLPMKTSSCLRRTINPSLQQKSLKRNSKARNRQSLIFLLILRASRLSLKTQKPKTSALQKSSTRSRLK